MKTLTDFITPALIQQLPEVGSALVDRARDLEDCQKTIDHQEEVLHKLRGQYQEMKRQMVERLQANYEPEEIAYLLR